MGISTEFGWFDSGYGLLESPSECGIEPPGHISHGFSWLLANIY